MAIPWGPIATVGSSLIGGAFSAFGARKQNDQAARLLGDQQRWNKYLYENRYKMQRNDMRRAGINPMLAYQTGAGQALGGTSYQPQNEYAQAGQMLADGVNSAISADRIDHEVKAIKQNIKKAVEETENTAEDTRLKRAQQKVAAAQERNINSDTIVKNGQAVLDSQRVMQTATETAYRKEQIKLALIDQFLAEATKERSAADLRFYRTEEGKAVRNLGRLFDELSPFTSSAKRLAR